MQAAIVGPAETGKSSTTSTDNEDEITGSYC